MNPPTQPIQLKPGDIRQAGDMIQELTIQEGCYGNIRGQRKSHTIAYNAVRPIASHTIERVILPADLIHAKFFRP